MCAEGLTAKLGLSLEVGTTCLETDVVTTETVWDGAVVTSVEASGAFSCTDKYKIK